MIHGAKFLLNSRKKIAEFSFYSLLAINMLSLAANHAHILNGDTNWTEMFPHESYKIKIEIN